MLISIYSPNGTYDDKFLANYAFINLNDPITRLPGIASGKHFTTSYPEFSAPEGHSVPFPCPIQCPASSLTHTHFFPDS